DSLPLPGHQIGTPSFTTLQQISGADQTSSGSFTPSPYPQFGARVYARYSSYEPTDWRAECRNTLYGFVWGCDPDVATAREIEASVYGFQSEHQDLTSTFQILDRK